MKKYIYTIIFLMISVPFFGQNKASMNDTIHRINEVEIVAYSPKKVNVGKIDVPLQYLPISVNTLSGKTLEARGITNIEDAVKFFSGVRMQERYGAFQTLYIRGFANAPVMIDGIRDERSIVNSNPFGSLTDAESIELLRGPASVLYGHSVLGGVLNITRKSPTPQTVVKTRMSYGSWNQKQANMDFGGKLAGPVNYRTSFNYADQDGWRDVENKRLSGYLALGADIDATSKVDFRGSFRRDNYGTDAGLPPFMMADIYNNDGSLFLKTGEELPGLNDKARYNNHSDFMKNNGWDMSGKYEKRFSESMKLTNYASYRYDDINYQSTESVDYLSSKDPIYKHHMRLNVNGQEIKTYINLDSVQLTSPLRFSHIAKTLTDQLELSGSFYTGSIKHNYMGGYSFTQMFRNSYTGYNNAPSNDILNSDYDMYGTGMYSVVAINNAQSMGYISSKFSKAIITKDYTHGIYFQDLIELSDQLKVLLAGRYDVYKYLRTGANTYDGKRQYHKSEQPEYSIATNSAFTYRAGLVYLPIPTVSLYGSVASYFRPNRTFPSGNSIYLDKNGDEMDVESGKGVFDPEYGNQFELGARYSYNKLLEFSGSVFYIKRNDVVRSFSRTIVGQDANNANILKTVVGQLSSERSQGVELEVAITPTAYANINVGYSYIDVKTRNIKSNPYLKSDNQLPTLVPHNTFYTYGGISVPKGVFKGLAYNLSISYMDKVYTNYTRTATYDSYWLADMGVSYPIKNGITVSGIVNNIFDKRYSNQSVGGMQRIPGKHRNYMVSISYSLN